MADGTIIFINGTSSSGKTSIIHNLQDLLAEPYLEAGIDKFIFMLPERFLERPLWDDVLGLAEKAGTTGHELVLGMHRAIFALSKAGCNIIADHVLVEPAWAQDCAELFAESNAYLVGVQCALEVMEQREHSRKNRTLGQARLQFPVIHRYCSYDLEVDTSLLTAEQCAKKIQKRLARPGQAFYLMKQMI
jgi:chloramphenicol 3-O phosphotransferase